MHCCILKIPLLGILHDYSKINPTEWLGIGRNFFPSTQSEKENNSELFKKAKKHHQKLNKHEVEHWYNSEGTCSEIPIKFLTEAMADWAAFGGICLSTSAIKANAKQCYLKWAHNYNLTKLNRQWVENFLEINANNNANKS